MQHIKLIKDEQLLEQISGGFSAPVIKLPIKGIISQIILKLKQVCKANTQAAYEKA
jgi:hypothetical protein